MRRVLTQRRQIASILARRRGSACGQARDSRAFGVPFDDAYGLSFRKISALCAATAALLLSAFASPALADGPPVITSTSASEAGESTATLRGVLDPNGVTAHAHFEYLTQAGYETAGNDFSGAQRAPASDIVVKKQVSGLGNAEKGSGIVKGVETETGAFVLGQTITSPGVLPSGTTILNVTPDPKAPGKLELFLSNKATKTQAPASLTAFSPGAAIATGDIASESLKVTNLNMASGVPSVHQPISGAGIPAGATIVEVKPTELTLSKAATATATGVLLTAASGQPLSAQLEGLSPGTQYRFRLVASNAESAGTPTIAEGAFYTLAPVPAFASCPNQAFRSGALPDCRAYEQASPLNKNGGDVLGEIQFSKAAADGSAVAFGSAFGLPGSEGAQERPFYLASRGEGDSGWSTKGLMPPASFGQKGQPLAGWTPNFDNAYAIAIRPGEGFNDALIELHRDGTPATQITPFVHDTVHNESAYYYVGSPKDESSVLFESKAKLPYSSPQDPFPSTRDGDPNVYAWDRATETIHLTSVMNMPAQTEALLPKGGIAGPYNWHFKEASRGGAELKYYLSDERAASIDGSVFFTAAGSGHLYQRINPTEPQSAVIHAGEPDEACTEPAKACTIDVSATKKENGEGPGGADAAGSQPAAFQAASADGKVAFFTSAEKLTGDANTGPEQPPAQIGRADLTDPDPNVAKEEGFLPTHALGTAVDPKDEYIYWVDPTKKTIGRAKLNPDGSHGPAEDDFIVPGETEVTLTPFEKPPVTLRSPSTPRYVAIGPCAEGGECVYWTNTGPIPSAAFGSPYFSAPGGPVYTAGTIGRAVLDASGHLVAGSIEPEFITGASDPQGIAVNSEHIYWANASQSGGAGARALARASLEGDEVEQSFFSMGNEEASGVALSPTHIYFSSNHTNSSGYLSRIPLEGGPEEVFFIGKGGVRGVAVDSSHVYWATQAEGEESIGRNGIAPSNFAAGAGGCANIPGCEKAFLTPKGSPYGLVIDSKESLYWSVNGEAPSNPGNDLYRHLAPGATGCVESGGCLEDLTPDTVGNGAEVQGVLGATPDGSYLYFAANGDLDGTGPAVRGNCVGTNGGDWNGHCNIYLWHDGQIEHVGSADLNGGADGDAWNWIQTPVGTAASTGSYDEKTSFVAPSGTLVFRSVVNQTGFDSGGAFEYYRYAPDSGISCLTCSPSGDNDGTKEVRLHSALLGTGVPVARSSSVQSHHLSADGERFYFETTEALVAGDVNGEAGCANVGFPPQKFFSCLDVYEWEAPEAGSCKVGGPGYSPLNQGCIYLISTGKSKYPSFFIDASQSGNDVFFLTRDQLVGSDTDHIQDAYDARVDGGLVSQNQTPPIPCEGDPCKPGSTPAPDFTSPPQIQGPGNPPVKRKPCKSRKAKKGHQRCGKHRKQGRGSRHHKVNSPHRHGGSK